MSKQIKASPFPTPSYLVLLLTSGSTKSLDCRTLKHIRAGCSLRSQSKANVLKDECFFISLWERTRKKKSNPVWANGCMIPGTLTYVWLKRLHHGLWESFALRVIHTVERLFTLVQRSFYHFLQFITLCHVSSLQRSSKVCATLLFFTYFSYPVTWPQIENCDAIYIADDTLLLSISA